MDQILTQRDICPSSIVCIRNLLINSYANKAIRFNCKKGFNIAHITLSLFTDCFLALLMQMRSHCFGIHNKGRLRNVIYFHPVNVFEAGWPIIPLRDWQMVQ
jgi:hypothetical protein